MIKYPKIQTVWKRDNKGIVIEGQFSIPEFEYLSNNQWYFTEKIDGTNLRINWDPNSILAKNRLSFAGRTDRAQIQPSLLKKLNNVFYADKFQLFQSLYPDTPMILFGEGFGKGIQKIGKKYISNDVDFILFDVKIDEWWLERENIENIAKSLKIQVVPLVGEGTLLEGCELVKKGFKSHIGNCIAEGLVMKPKVQLLSRRSIPVKAKIKYKDFTESN